MTGESINAQYTINNHAINQKTYFFAAFAKASSKIILLQAKAAGISPKISLLRPT